MNSDIQQWLQCPDYASGLALLEQYGNNPHLLRHYRQRSPRFAIADLTADLCRIGRQTAAAQDRSAATSPTAQGGLPALSESKTAQTAKKLVHEYWVNASRLQLQLHDLGTGNSEPEKEQRRQVMEQRDAAMEQYNRLYNLKEDFFAGKMTEEELKAALDLKPTKEETAAKKADLSGLSDLELSRRLKSKKDSLRLVKKKLDIPDCPKRRQITADINNRQAEISLLEAEYKKRKLNQRSNKK